MMQKKHGLLVLDKPKEMTSRAVVNRVQRLFPKKTRVGHTGTLDPLATGVLVICVGVATRLAEYVQAMEKTYVCRIRLGARSNTDDAEGEIVEAESVEPPEIESIKMAAQGFVGRLDQVPPTFSAARVAGRRAYDLARADKSIELKPRTIRVHAIKVVDYCYPTLDVEVRCGRGTYIRSLARDLGEHLGCGGYVEALRRTRVGIFSDEQALPVELDRTVAFEHLLPIEQAVADMPRVTVDAARAQALEYGQAIAFAEPMPENDVVAIFDDQEVLLAVATLDSGQQLLRPHKVLRTG